MRDEYTEWHLTPTGWVRGTEQRNYGSARIVPPPANRVKSVQYYEIPKGIEGEKIKGVSSTYQGADFKFTDSLESTFGTCPEKL